MKRNDGLWKGILEDIFDDFLVFIFGIKAALFDFSRGFVFLNKELAQIFPVDENTTHPRFVDKLVKVFTTEGKEECPPGWYGRGYWYMLKYRVITMPILHGGCSLIFTAYLISLTSG